MFDINENTSGFDITKLSLNGIQAATGVSVLPPGRYVCTIKGIKVEKTKDSSGRFLAVALTEVGGGRVITARLNIENKSVEAVRIGMEQLKGLAESAGVADPNQPFAGGLSAMNGLEVGVIVKSDSYKGEARSQVGGFCKPADVPAQSASAARPAGSIGTDDIPF